MALRSMRFHRRAALACALAGLLVGAPATAGWARPGGGSAAATLRVMAKALREARDDTARRRAADAVSAAGRTLLTTDGRLVSIEDLRSEIDAVGGAQPEVSQAAAARLASRLDALAEALPAEGDRPPRADPRLLASILGSREFHGGNPLSAAFVRFVEAVQRWIGQWEFGAIGGPGGRGRVVLVLIVLAAVAAAAAAAFVLRARRHLAGSARPADAASRPGAEGQPIEPADAYAAAEALAASGDLDGAMRVLFGALPVAFAEAGLVARRIELTNGDLLRAARYRRPALVAPLTDLVATFERCFYGGRHLDLPGWERFRDGWRNLHGGLTGGPG